MLIYTKWLEEYVDLPDDINLYSEKMIMSGSNIETIEKCFESPGNIVIGKVIKVVPHEKSEKLLICTVDVGKEDYLTIVTGAPNVKEGVLIPTALPGAKLEKEIQKTTLLGVESEGMLCSAKELGLEDAFAKNELWVLKGDFKVGEEIEKALDLSGYVIDFEITPNRPDCLSLIGMARETAATLDTSFKYPEMECKNETEDAKDYIDVEIKRPDLCERYLARIVTDVKIFESPWWLQRSLIYSGMRPINNIVDISNYVMLEFGRPLHAFDISTIHNKKIVVDAAKDGETFITLDNNLRKLDKDMLLIKDDEKALAIAGVMGGLDSGITESTKTILIESACFNKDSVRRTSKKLGLRSEASSRFEKGVDAETAKLAADRMCYLIEKLGAGKVIKGEVDAYHKSHERKEVKLRTKRINDVLGINLKPEEIYKLLERLEIKAKIDGDILTVDPPYSRLDLNEEVDYIEEVARIYGFDKLPETLPKGSSFSVKEPFDNFKDKLRNALVGMSSVEIKTYSFIGNEDLEKTDLQSDNLIRLINPLGEENSIMRPSLLPSLFTVMERNYTRGIKEVSAFEIGRIFSEKENPVENNSLVIGMYNKGDFFTLKGIVDELLLLTTDKNGLWKEAEQVKSLWHPGRFAEVFVNDKKIVSAGEIHPEIIKQYDLPDRVYVAEIDLDTLFKQQREKTLYKSIERFPQVERDIALVTKESTKTGDILDIIENAGSKLLKEVSVFDIYRGKQIKEGYKSVAIRLCYRSSERTLTEEEVNKEHEEIILRSLKENLDISLRDI